MNRVGAYPCECSDGAPNGYGHEPQCPCYRKELTDLRLENRRLRQALEAIAGDYYHDRHAIAAAEALA